MSVTHESDQIVDGDQLWLPVIAHVVGNGAPTFTAAYSGNNVTGHASTDTHKNKPTNYPDL